MIIRSVKTRAFKYYTRTFSDQPFYFIVALRALFKRFIAYLLKNIKNLIAVCAFVFVSRHFTSLRSVSSHDNYYLNTFLILSVKLFLSISSPERRANSSIAWRCCKVNRWGIWTLTLTNSSPLFL